MPQVLVIDDDPSSLQSYGELLHWAGHRTITALSGCSGLEIIRRHPTDVVICDLRLPDISGLEVLQHAQRIGLDIPFLIVTGFGTVRDAVEAVRLGAVDVLEKPVPPDDLLRAIDTAVATTAREGRQARRESEPREPEAHAACRWARAVVPVINSPRDPRTIAGWSREVAASPGALKNWCRTIGVSPRRSLVFARLLRAVFLRQEGHRPENLLDVVDRRTLDSLLAFAGLDTGEFPVSIDEFLRRQRLISDRQALGEVRRAMITKSTTLSPTERS